MRIITSEEAASRYGITTRHEETENSELRFRLEKSDGVAYIRTDASAQGAWQQSHFHATASETYIVQRGWIAHASLVHGVRQIMLIRAGELITTPPGIIHNIYMPPNAEMHTVKHGDASTGEAIRNDETARFDISTQGLSENEIVKTATYMKGGGSFETQLCSITEPKKTDLYSQDYRHFDTLIWQVPTWSSAIFALTAAATGATLSNASQIPNSLSASVSTILAFFLGTVTFVLLLLWNVLLRFRMRQIGITLPPETFIPPKLFPLPGGQVCLQLIVAVESVVLLAACLLAAGILGNYGVIIVVGLLLVLVAFGELAVRYAKKQSEKRFNPAVNRGAAL